MRDKTIRAVFATLILMGIAIAALAQMGGPGGDPSAISITSDDSAADTESESGTTVPGEDFVYRLGVLSGVSTDNFWAFYGEEPSVWNSYILGPTKPALFRIDPVDGTLVPELATRMASPTWSTTGWHVLVELSESLRWSDGTPITAEDFVFTFETVRELGLAGSWATAFPEAVKSIHAESDKTLRIEFAERPTLGVWPHSVGTAPVMPVHVWDALIEEGSAESLYRQAGDVDVAGGPLAIDEVGTGVIRSVANPGYGLEDAPDIVEYHVYDSEDAAVSALSTGEIDTILSPKGLSRDHIQSLEDHPDVAVGSSSANGIRYLGFNLNRPPMGERAFRRALALILDREQAASELTGGASVPHSFVSESSGLWYDADLAAENAALYAGDAEVRFQGALEGLRQAGYTWQTAPAPRSPGRGLKIDGAEPAPLTILTPGDSYDPDRPLYAEQIAETLQLLGFDVHVVTTDFDSVVDLTFSTDEQGQLQYDMYLLGWTLGNPALPDYYRPLFAADGVENNTGYSSSRFEEALHAYEQAYTREEAKKALWKMERTLAEDLPYLLLYTSEMTEAHRSDRVAFSLDNAIGGLQGRLGGIGDVTPVG